MSMLTRQAMLVLAAAVVAGTLLGSAFAQDPAPVHGGSITVGIVAEPPGWDPSASTSQEIPRVVYHNVYECLVRFDRSGATVHALATCWRTS